MVKNVIMGILSQLSPKGNDYFALRGKDPLIFGGTQGEKTGEKTGIKEIAQIKDILLTE